MGLLGWFGLVWVGFGSLRVKEGLCSEEGVLEDVVVTCFPCRVVFLCCL